MYYCFGNICGADRKEQFHMCVETLFNRVNATRFGVIVRASDKRFNPTTLCFVQYGDSKQVLIERGGKLSRLLFFELTCAYSFNANVYVSMVDYIPNPASITWYE